MNIDKPLCSMQTCRHYFDGNCINDQAFDRCEYANAIGELARLAPLADLWEQRAAAFCALWCMELIDARPETAREFFDRQKISSYTDILRVIDHNIFSPSLSDDYPEFKALIHEMLNRRYVLWRRERSHERP